MDKRDIPLKTVGSTIVYQNPWMTVYEDAMRNSDGREGIYGYIDSKPGIFVIALTQDGKMHLIESFRYPTQRWQWELPTGGIDKGLTPLEAAKHELKEELGMTADKWTHVNTFGPSSNGFMKDTQEVFVAEGLHKGKAHQDGFEAIRAGKTVSLDEVMNLIQKGILIDGQSLAALMQFMAWRNK